MKVTLVESGGWTNVKRSCTVDTATLAPEVAWQLEQACAAALVAPVPVATPRARDVRMLTLEVEFGGSSRCASFNELAAPAALAPVIKMLRPLCRPVPNARA